MKNLVLVLIFTVSASFASSSFAQAGEGMFSANELGVVLKHPKVIEQLNFLIERLTAIERDLTLRGTI